MEMKKTLSLLETGILSSLSGSYMMLPFMVFSTLIGGNSGIVNFFVPVVILYSIERACLIALRGFGEIQNPYRILKGGVLIALVGAILMMLSAFYFPLLMISAVFIGLGLAPAKAMFIPIFSSLVEKDPSLKKGGSIGTLLYFALIIVVMCFGHSALPVAPVLFILYMVAIAWIVIRFDGDSIYGGKRAFDYGKKNGVFFVFAVLALLSLLILRQYKESGISVLMWLTPVLVIVFLCLEIHRRRGYRMYSFQTYWAGAVSSFLLLYSLVYHSSVGNKSMSTLVYVALTAGSFLTGIFRKALKKALPGEKGINVAMVLSALFALLVSLPSNVLNLLGIALSSSFSGVVSYHCGVKYMEDQRHARLERPLVKLRIQTTGSIIEQLLLFFSIYFLGEFGLHQNLLEAYVAGEPDAGLAPLLRSAGLVSAIILLLGALIIIFAFGRGKNGEQKQ